jgi:hypothetical protein
MSGKMVRVFSILLHEGNVPGFPKEVFKGTKFEASRRAKKLNDKLSKEQQEKGWWYEAIEDLTTPVPRPPGVESHERRVRRVNPRR